MTEPEVTLPVAAGCLQGDVLHSAGNRDLTRKPAGTSLGEREGGVKASNTELQGCRGDEHTQCRDSYE